MSQQLSVNLTVPIPEGMTLIQSVELDDMNQQLSKGQIRDLKWFKEKVCVYGNDDIRELLLIPFKDEFDVENGGFVVYPETNGQQYKFQQTRTEEWLENNFGRVNWKKKSAS